MSNDPAKRRIISAVKHLLTLSTKKETLRAPNAMEIMLDRAVKDIDRCLKRYPNYSELVKQHNLMASIDDFIPPYYDSNLLYVKLFQEIISNILLRWKTEATRYRDEQASYYADREFDEDGLPIGPDPRPEESLPVEKPRGITGDETLRLTTFLRQFRLTPDWSLPQSSRPSSSETPIPQPPGFKKKTTKTKRKPGPELHPFTKEEMRVLELHRDPKYRAYKEIARALGMTAKEVGKIIDKDRKRKNRSQTGLPDTTCQES